jgi:DNA helicase-2/ATP-dependent DNA helicase PcrA
MYLLTHKLGGAHRSGQWRKYQHLVVDEVQDFGPIELATIASVIKAPHQVTLVGDVAQQLGEVQIFPGWEAVLAEWKLEQCHYISLAVSHRSTLPIMKYATAIDSRVKVSQGRDGRRPIWFRCGDERTGFGWVVKWLEQAVVRYPGTMTAVLCRSKDEAKLVHSFLEPTFGSAIRSGDEDDFSFGEGIIVAPIEMVKGLEFTNVLLWNPNATRYKLNDEDRALLYVAATRAEENLCLVTWGAPSQLLPQEATKLVRVVSDIPNEIK